MDGLWSTLGLNKKKRALVVFNLPRTCIGRKGSVQKSGILMRSTSRREFLIAGGMAAVAASLPRSGTASPMGRPIGIQLYTVGKPMQQDAPGTLKKLHEIGYREVETAGFGKYSAKEFRGLMDDAGLVCPSAHLPLVKGELGPLFEDAHTVGARYATSSMLVSARPDGSPQKLDTLGQDGFKQMAAHMNEIGAKAKQAGLKYAYHNHNFEFQSTGNGERGYDILLRETDPSVVWFEIDCGWMTVAGASPVAYMQKSPGRFRMLHIKDFQPVAQPTTDLSGAGRPQGTELGKGFIQYKAIFAEGRKAGIEHCFAEQEGPYTVPPLEAAEADYKYLASFS